MSKNTSQWHSCLKRMSSYDQEKTGQIILPDINHLSEEDQAQRLAEHFSKIPNEYNPLKNEDIIVPPIDKSDIPQFKDDIVTTVNKQKYSPRGHPS